LSFPKFGHPACAWVALAPLLVAIARTCGRAGSPTSPRPVRRAFLLGLASGLVYFAGALYWLVDVMVIYGGLAQLVASALAALLVTYLALHPAVFALIVGALWRRAGTWALALAPAVWVATELGRATLVMAFPWALLGASQATQGPVAQLASVTGIYGVSALVAFGSAAAAMAVMGRGLRRIVAPLSVVILILIVVAWGRARIASGELTGQGTPVRVGLVQGNFSQDIKWEASLCP
jgi:apolipoprotein N-acyltransferase